MKGLWLRLDPNRYERREIKRRIANLGRTVRFKSSQTN